MTISKKQIKNGMPFLFAIVTYLILLIFKNNPKLTEVCFAQGVYPQLAFFMSHLSVMVPFSLDDLFYSVLVVLFLVSFVLVIIRKLRVKMFLLSISQVIACVYVVFYWVWGFNYYRQGAHERLNIPESKPNEEVFISVFKKVITQTNHFYTLSNGLEDFDFQPILEDSYKELQCFLKIDYPAGKRRRKYITYSDFFAKASILGYYGPFFNEIHVNKHLTVWDKPVVLAHEMAHQFGVTSEAEANFYAWLVCVNSDNEFANYSGWLYALKFFIYESRNLEERKDLIRMIRAEVVSDYKERRKYWRDLSDKKINKAAGKVNDVYLKSNNLKNGVEDYNDMVQFVVDLYLAKETAAYFNNSEE